MLKRWWIVIVSMIAIVIIFLAIRGCSSHTIETKNFRIARDPTWFPVPLFGKEKNLVAFTDDVLNAIAAEEHITFNLVSSIPDALFPGLDNDTYDAILTFALPQERSRYHFLTSEPFFFIGPVLVISKKPLPHSPFPDKNILTLADLKGRAIAIQSFASTIFSKDGSDIFFIPYENMSIALDDVAKQKIDGAILGALPAYLYVSGIYSSTLRVAASPLTSEGLRLVTEDDVLDEELIARFNSGLKKIKNNGVYDQLLKKWGFINPEIKINN